MNNKNFISVIHIDEKFELNKMLQSEYTRHLNEERQYRLNKAMEINGDAEIIDSFLVDKGHINGPEIHCITIRGIIFVFNEYSRKFITVLLARPNQVVRLYKECNLKVPKGMLKHCQEYVENNLNYI